MIKENPMKIRVNPLFARIIKYEAIKNNTSVIKITKQIAERYKESNKERLW